MTSDRSIEVPNLFFGNYDRPTDQPTDQQTKMKVKIMNAPLIFLKVTVRMLSDFIVWELSPEIRNVPSGMKKIKYR